MIIYWDFDGVLVDSWEIINGMKNSIIIEDYESFYSTLDWKYILENAKAIVQNWLVLKRLNTEYQTIILTAFSSSNEIRQKTEWIKKYCGDIETIFVPHDMVKSEFVDCKDNVLIDDNKRIIDEWNANGGIGVLYENKADFMRKISDIFGAIL